MLRQKRLLYLTANRLAAYGATRSGLALDAAFERDDAGIAAFTKYLAGTRNLYYLVIDVVEEDYHQDVIPFLGRKDRKMVLGRKLAQRYRDTSLSLSTSLGYEKAERRNEKVLYASFSNTQQFQPWLSALESSECRLVGIYSTALLAPAVIKSAGLKLQRCLLVSAQQSGLRQSYVEDDQIRFSRVGRLNLEDVDAVAALCASESARLQQYLVTMRLLPTASTSIDVMVLAPARYHAALTQACRSSEVLTFHLVNADEQCKTAGLKRFPQDAPCEALFLNAVATAAPKDQFAQEKSRHHYRVWQLGRILFAAGAAVLGTGLLFAGERMIEGYTLRSRIDSDQKQYEALNAEYARITATFPHTTTSTENLKTTIKLFRQLQAQTATPAYLYSEISRALAGFPQVELERIDWKVGDAPPTQTRNRGAPVVAPPPSAGAKDAGGDQYAIATVSARVVGARRVDLRAITEMAEQVIDTFRKNPQFQVSGVRMPFAITAEDTLSGEIGSERAIAEDASFRFTIASRIAR